MRFNRINQIHEDGCLIACLAMITGSSYVNVLNKLLPDFPKDYYYNKYCRVGYFDINQIEDILNYFNINYTKSLNNDLSSLNKDALITIQWKKEPHISHCILFDNKSKSFIDPSIYLSSKCNKNIYQKNIHSVFLL